MRQDSPETKPTPETDQVQDRWRFDSVWFGLIRFVSEGQGMLGMLGMFLSRTLRSSTCPKPKLPLGPKSAQQLAWPKPRSSQRRRRSEVQVASHWRVSVKKYIYNIIIIYVIYCKRTCHTCIVNTHIYISSIMYTYTVLYSWDAFSIT